MRNLKCSCGGNIIACRLYQTSYDHYVKKDGTLYKKWFRHQPEGTMEQIIYVCDSCAKQEEYVEDFIK